MINRVFWLILLTVFSCNNKDLEVRNYYNELLQINNELLFEIYETLYETRKCISYSDQDQKADTSFHALLKQRLNHISQLSTRNLDRLQEMGSLDDDSILYKTFIQSFRQLDELSRNEFSTILDCILIGEMTQKRIDALYTASIKLAENHISVLDSLTKFSRRYNIDMHLTEIDYHRRKTERFKRDISRITRSVCLSGNCIDGFGQQQDERGTLYSGYFNNGLFHGKGKLVDSVGNTYEGGFSNGSFQGYGTYEWKTGKKYVGEWREDEFNGIGTMYTENDDTIFGYWQNGVLKKFN